MTGSAAPCYPGSVRRALLFSSVLLVGCPPAAGVCPEPLAGLAAAERLEGHLEALADIADAHGGTRAAGTPGYTASVEYVVAALAEAGLRVTRQPFEFPAHELLATQTQVGRLRGRWHRYGPAAIPLLVTYHPAYLLRSPAEKGKSLDDLERVLDVLEGRAAPDCGPDAS